MHSRHFILHIDWQEIERQKLKKEMGSISFEFPLGNDSLSLRKCINWGFRNFLCLRFQTVIVSKIRFPSALFFLSFLSIYVNGSQEEMASLMILGSNSISILTERHTYLEHLVVKDSIWKRALNDTREAGPALVLWALNPMGAGHRWATTCIGHRFEKTMTKRALS